MSTNIFIYLNTLKIFEQCSCISNGTSPSFARLIDDNFTMSTTTENTASRLDYNFESFEVSLLYLNQS